MQHMTLPEILGDFGGAPTWKLQNICAKAPLFFIIRSRRHVAHVLAVQIKAFLFALAPGHAERTAMSSWILVPGPFKTMKFD